MNATLTKQEIDDLAVPRRLRRGGPTGAGAAVKPGTPVLIRDLDVMGVVVASVRRPRGYVVEVTSTYATPGRRVFRAAGQLEAT
jgi:hypothetical protein